MTRALHTLTLTMEGKPERYLSPFGYYVTDLGDYTATIECIPGGCLGWIECREEHTVDGYTGPNDGPYDSGEDAPWADKEETEFHGVMHTWRSGWGWTVPYPGCVLAEQDTSDNEHDILMEYGPGAYLVDEDWWDETSVTISPVSMADGSPLPEPGWAARVLADENEGNTDGSV